MMSRVPKALRTSALSIAPPARVVAGRCYRSVGASVKSCVNWNLRYGPMFSSVSHWRVADVTLCPPLLRLRNRRQRSFSRRPRADPASSEGWRPATTLRRDTPAGVDLALRLGQSARSRRMPSESLDAPENLPKEALRQVALGQLEHEIPRMPDQPPAGLEQALLQARQRPALDGDRQNEPTQQIAEVVGDHPEEQPDLIGSEAVAGEAGPMGDFLDPLLCRPTLVVEMDDGAVRPGER